MLLDQIGAYWDDRADGYSLTIHEQLKGDTAQQFRRLFRRIAPKGGYLSCLDAGCGPGFFSILLSQAGHHVTSMDYSPEMLKRTQANLREAGFEPNTVQGDVQSLPFADESFHFIVSRDCVWCLEHPERAYAEWLRVLKPGGRIFVSDGNYYLYHYSESYRKERLLREKLAQARGESASHPTYGVDPTRINEIAKDLPLSKLERPRWDIDTLDALGYRNIQFQTDGHLFADPDTGEKYLHNGHFLIWGEK